MPSVRPRTVEVTKRSTVVLVWNPARGRWVSPEGPSLRRAAR